MDTHCCASRAGGLPRLRLWKKPGGLCARLLPALLLCLLAALGGCAPARAPGLEDAPALVVRISDWKTGQRYVEEPVRPGSRLSFGWIHSWEHIPWNEYYHVDGRQLVLDTITFPAFGAGIPEDKGRVCIIRDGLIIMSEIDQRFPELVWLNSHTATQEIAVDGKVITRGTFLPQHVRLRLRIETR